MLPFIPLFMGYAKGHMITLILCGLFAAYGAYIFHYSFGNGMYDISFVFNEDNFTVKNRKGEKVHSYSEISIPFTMKKSTCDTLYSFLMEKVTIEELTDGQIKA